MGTYLPGVKERDVLLGALKDARTALNSADASKIAIARDILVEAFDNYQEFYDENNLRDRDFANVSSVLFECDSDV